MENQSKTTRAEGAYRLLKTEIRLNRMAPGLQLTEPELAQRFSVGRSTIREALIRLESEGLVELIPRKGMRVLPLRVEDMREIYEMLMVLEPNIAGKLATKGLTDRELEPIEQAMHDMEVALENQDLETWAGADDRFHMGLLSLHGNHRLSAVVAELSDQVHRARMITLRLRDMPTKSNAEHRIIVDCIRSQDVKGAISAFSQHRCRAADELVSILEKSGIGQL